MSTLTVKRGQTISYAGVFTDPDTGERASLAGYSIACDIVLRNTRQSVTTEISDIAAGDFLLNVDADVCDTLPLGLWRGDLRFLDANDRVEYSDTFFILVEDRVTNAPS